MTTYITPNADGSLQEVAPLIVSAGATSAGKIPGLNSLGQLDSSMIPSGGSQAINYDGGAASQPVGVLNIDMGGV